MGPVVVVSLGQRHGDSACNQSREPSFDGGALLAGILAGKHVADIATDADQIEPGRVPDRPGEPRPVGMEIRNGQHPGELSVTLANERKTHSIKGASANVGGEALYQVAFEMEIAAKAGDLGSIQMRLPELEEAFNQLEKRSKDCISR